MPRRRKRAFSYHAGSLWMARSSPAMRRGLPPILCFFRTPRRWRRGHRSASRRAGRGGASCWPPRARWCCWARPGTLARAHLAGWFRASIQPGWAATGAAAAGYLPGAASLLCEAGGRRLLYAGTICRERAFANLGAAEVRSADAVCLDATFGIRALCCHRARRQRGRCGGSWRQPWPRGVPRSCSCRPLARRQRRWRRCRPLESPYARTAPSWRRWPASVRPGLRCRRCVVLRGNWTPTRH